MAVEPRIKYLASRKVLDPIALDDSTLQSFQELDYLRSKWHSVKQIKGIGKSKMDEYFITKYAYQSIRYKAIL